MCINSLTFENLNNLYHTIPDDYKGLTPTSCWWHTIVISTLISLQKTRNLDIIKSLLYSDPLKLRFVPDKLPWKLLF